MLRGPDDARELAKKILQEKRFQPGEPSALRRPLAWIGRQVSSIFAPFGRGISWLFSRLLASPVLAALFVGAVVVAVFFGVRRAATRRVGSFATAEVDAEGAQLLDPTALERDADAAAAAGDHERSVRLRFRAGLARLTRSGRLPSHEVTNGEARSRIEAPEFEELADNFDEIVYGGRAATSDDSTEARTTWPKLTGSSRR